MEKRIFISGLFICSALFGAVFLCPAYAYEASNGNVRLVSTIDSGGLVQSRDDVQITSFIGELGAVSSNGNVVARLGGNSAILSAARLSVASDAATINERGAPDTNSTRTQLRGDVVYDDGTVSALDGALIAWTSSATNSGLGSISTGPITQGGFTDQNTSPSLALSNGDGVVWPAPATASTLASISAEGVVQAGTVYQATAASFTGSYGGINATSSLTVLNILPDNYGALANDTFDDAWEVAQGMTNKVNPSALNNGVPNWQLYAMGYNPAQPAPAVLASHSITTNGYLSLSYTRNPYATNYGFNPQESGDLSAGFENMVDPVSVTNTSGGLDCITTRGSVPIDATNKQFLRVNIVRPAAGFPTPLPPIYH